METTLAKVNIGERGRIISIQNPDLQIALLNLGLIPGETFELTEIAPLGDPIALRILGTKIALRKHHAQQIIVQKS